MTLIKSTAQWTLVPFSGLAYAGLDAFFWGLAMPVRIGVRLSRNKLEKQSMPEQHQTETHLRCDGQNPFKPGKA